MEEIKEYSSEELDRIVINKETKKVKILLGNGNRILIDFDRIQYID